MFHYNKVQRKVENHEYTDYIWSNKYENEIFRRDLVKVLVKRYKMTESHAEWIYDFCYDISLRAGSLSVLSVYNKVILKANLMSVA